MTILQKVEQGTNNSQTRQISIYKCRCSF